MVGFTVISLIGCATHYHRSDSDSVHMYLIRPGAGIVSFAHSADGYRIHSAQKSGAWTWKVKVPGRYEFRYFYLVNGKTYLPDCRLRERDDFGAQNCIYSPDM